MTKEQFEHRVTVFKEIWSVLLYNRDMLREPYQGYVEGFTFPCSIFYKKGINCDPRIEKPYRRGIAAVHQYVEENGGTIHSTYSHSARKGLKDGVAFLESGVKRFATE